MSFLGRVCCAIDVRFQGYQDRFFSGGYFFKIFGDWFIWEYFFEHFDEVAILEYLVIKENGGWHCQISERFVWLGDDLFAEFGHL